MTISTIFFELIRVVGNQLFSVNCNVFILVRDWGKKKTLNLYQGIKYFKNSPINLTCLALNQIQ